MPRALYLSIFTFPGFEALTEIQNLLSSNAHDPSIKESLIIDASNRFFTVIPSIHPHVIRDEDDFKSKVQEAKCDNIIDVFYSAAFLCLSYGGYLIGWFPYGHSNY